MDSNHINSQQNVKISAAQFGAKYRSKREVFNLLVLDAKAYLPKYETLTICKFQHSFP